MPYGGRQTAGLSQTAAGAEPGFLSSIDPTTLGTIAGGAVGAGVGAASLMEKRKARKAEEKRLKRQERAQKMAAFQDTVVQGQATRQAAMASLSQAAFDWAQAYR